MGPFGVTHSATVRLQCRFHLANSGVQTFTCGTKSILVANWGSQSHLAGGRSIGVTLNTLMHLSLNLA